MSKNIYTIYKATCEINGKSYIGFDSNWPERKSRHLYNKNSKYAIHRAINKHGWENFEWQPIYQSLDRDHCLKIMEPYFIEVYDTYKNGYNMTIGGDGTFGYHHKPETKLKISESRIGNTWALGSHHSEEHKKYVSKRQIGEKNHFFGKHHSEETKNKMRESQKKRAEALS